MVFSISFVFLMIGLMVYPVKALILSIAKMFNGSAIASVRRSPITEIGMIWYFMATSLGMILISSGSDRKALILSIAKMFNGSAIASVRRSPITEIGMIWYFMATSLGMILISSGSIFRREILMGG